MTELAGDRTLVAVFGDTGSAESCVGSLERHGFEAATGVRPVQLRMGRNVATGATIGATVGLLAATSALAPLGSLGAAGAMVSTLAGASVGSFLGGLTEHSRAHSGEGAAVEPPANDRDEVLVLVVVLAGQESEARRLIGLWSPQEVRVQTSER